MALHQKLQLEDSTSGTTILSSIYTYVLIYLLIDVFIYYFESTFSMPLFYLCLIVYVFIYYHVFI
jgi:hypothetical protein